MDQTKNAVGLGVKLEGLGHLILRYGLVVVVGWIGALKFTEYEDKGIEGLIVNSPFMAWANQLLGLRTFCGVVGASEIVIAVLIALRYVAPKASVVGGFGAILMFLTTLSFMFSTPGVLQPEGLPFLSPAVGEFLIKDIVLLGAAIWMTGDSIRASTAAPTE